MSVYSPQKGFQQEFLSANADIIIGGGAAGCGKTFALLIAPFRSDWILNKYFNATIFRRMYPEITVQGGLLFESENIYPNLTGKKTDLKWKFKSGATIEFRHMQHEKDLPKYQGAQFPFVGMDELTTFTEKQFWFIQSRIRSANIKTTAFYATCNPDPDSFVKNIINWWINEDGFPIYERSGINRYFIRIKEAFIWGGSRDEVIKIGGDALDELKYNEEKEGRDIKKLIKSITFVPGKLSDNKILNEVNPQYRANLLAMSEEDKMRFLYGNWKIKLAGNLLFEADKIEGIIDYTPPKSKGRYITCDAAAHGRDLMVIYVWDGFCVIAISVQTKSEPREIYEEIERLRRLFNITKNNTIIDADGIGNDTVKLGNYQAFHGNSACRYDKTINKRENYKNFKTQCYYHMAKRVNELTVGFMVTYNNCWVNGRNSSTISIKNELHKINDLIKQHLRAIRKGKTDGEYKLTINSKDEQKIILNESSPDFADTLMMREFFEFNTLLTL